MKQAIILAAGEGQRLRPFTGTKPKVMLSIAGKPMLQYVVEALAQNGIHNIVIVVGYKKEQVFDYFGAGEQFGVDIVYRTQAKQLGTAHALGPVKDIAEDEFLVLPGDNLIEADTIAQFVGVRSNAVLVKKVENTARYGLVVIENGVVNNILEKSNQPVSDSGIINTGIYAFNREIFDFVKTELDIPEVINSMVAQGYTINALSTAGTWLDAVYPWDILSLNDAVLQRLPATLGGTIEAGASVKGLVSIGKNTVIRSGSYLVGPVVIGRNCDIGPNVSILPSTSIGDNVTISSFSEIQNSVISNDVNIGASSIIQDSVIDEGSVIKGHLVACSGEAEVKVNGEFHKINVGAMLGVGCDLKACIVAQPGVIIGNYCQIQSMKLISGRLPDKSVVF